jgi:hypothetical protein
MRHYISIATFLFFFLSTRAEPSAGAHCDTVIVNDYLNVPGPIFFDGATFNLAWNSHPKTGLYVQEYIMNQEQVEHYSKMFLIQTIEDTLKIEQLLSVQLSLLEKRKQTDKVLNYAVFNNPDKTNYILDFVMSKGNDEINMVEWNTYRYQYFTDKHGRKGILLLGVSFREYDNPTSFLTSLPQLRKKEIAALIKYNAPEIILQ